MIKGKSTGQYSKVYMKSFGSLPKSSSASSYRFVSTLLVSQIISQIQKQGYQYHKYLLALAEPRTGLVAPLVFFLPIVFSLCSFCFSFARVVSADEALRTSTSLRGAESSRTWYSTNVGQRGLFWCRLMMYSIILLDNSWKSSFVRGWEDMR